MKQSVSQSIVKVALSFHTRVWFTVLHFDNVNIDYYTSDYSAETNKKKLLISTKLSAESTNDFNAHQSVFVCFSLKQLQQPSHVLNRMNYTTVSAQLIKQSLTF